MAFTRYSTAAQVKANNNQIERKMTIDADIEDRIDQADKHIKSKLSNLVDFTVIDAMAIVPDWLNMLSQYLSMVFCLAFVYGAKRDVAEVSDLKFWQDMFNELLTECLEGEIDFGDAALGGVNFTWDSRRHVKPMFGPAYNPDSDSDDYGEYKDLEDLQDDREYDNTGNA
jgi:hypothetical protein